MTAVRYYSKSGNTKKVAEAIASSLNITAKSIDETAPVCSLLFLGGAIYGGNLDPNLIKYIEKLTFDNVQNIAVFSTGAGKKPLLPNVKAALKDNRINIVGEEFHCKGKFLIFNRKRPDEQDLAIAKEFARKTAGMAGQI